MLRSYWSTPASWAVVLRIRAPLGTTSASEMSRGGRSPVEIRCSTLDAFTAERFTPGTGVARPVTVDGADCPLPMRATAKPPTDSTTAHVRTTSAGRSDGGAARRATGVSSPSSGSSPRSEVVVTGWSFLPASILCRGPNQEVYLSHEPERPPAWCEHAGRVTLNR